MTKLEIMKKIEDYRGINDYTICEYFAKRLPKWVLEEILKRCDSYHCIVLHKDHVYTYYPDNYYHDFDYYRKG